MSRGNVVVRKGPWPFIAALLGTLAAGCGHAPTTPADHYTVARVPSLSDEPRWATIALSARRHVRTWDSTPSSQPGTSMSMDFNTTPIPAGSTVWFNAVVKYSGPNTDVVTIVMDSAFVQFTANGVAYSVPVPRTILTFSPTASKAMTSYDQNLGAWLTTAPYGLSGNMLFSAASFPVVAGLPGGIKGLIWRANVTTSTPGVSLQWKWGAAVYAGMPLDYNAVLVKPTDSNNASAYLNSDHAGTPEAAKASLQAGGTGGGGSNYTGGYSGSTNFWPPPVAMNSRTFPVSATSGGTFTFSRYTLSVPPGAISSDGQITITDPNSGLVGCDLSISPNTLNPFLSPVQLTMNCQNSNVTSSNISSLSIFWEIQDGVWYNMGASSDPDNLTITTRLPHFSEYRAGW